MPISTASYTLLNGVRQMIVAPNTQPQHVCIHNHAHSSSSTVVIGGGDVTLENGIHAQPELTSQITIGPGDSLHAMSDTDGVELQIMVIKQD